MTAPMFTISDTAFVVCAFSIFIVPLAPAALALINTGLGRSRNAAHTLLSSLCVFAVAMLVYLACGFGWQGVAGSAAHRFMLLGKEWNWLAAGPFFFRGLAFNRDPVSLAACLQLFSVGLAAAIPLGGGAERWRMGASCASTVLLAGWVYPMFAHWVWAGGWLAQLGSAFGLGAGFIDGGGAATIQVLGGLTALAITWILGPRKGKYESSGFSAAIPGHNAVLVLFGCMLALLGWTGLDSATSILFLNAQPEWIVLIVMNNALAASAAVLAMLLLTKIRFGKPDAWLSANGWISGLVAVSGGCAFLLPWEAVFIGAVAGVLAAFSVEWLDRLAVDDPGGAVSVHALGGIWGILAAGLFARVPGGPASGQLLAQMAGIATLLGFVLPLTYALNWLLNRIIPQRVPAEGELLGMDSYELGGGAYPELASLTELDHYRS